MKILIIGKNRKKNLKIQVTKIYFQIFFQFLLIIQQQMNQQILDNFVKKTISLNENVHFPGDYFSSKLQEIEMEFNEKSSSAKL